MGLTMTFSARDFLEEDFKTYYEWCSHNDDPGLPKSHLSAHGIMVMQGSTKVACCFLYGTGTGMWFLSWVNVNPMSSPRVKSEGLKALYDAAKAKVGPDGVIFYFIRHKSFYRHAVKHGFIFIEDVKLTIARGK